jgi:hypothetical protein
VIARLWRGRCTPQSATPYEKLLLEEILPDLDVAPGCSGAYVLRRDEGAAVEFLVLHLFESLDAVRVFAGENYDQAIVPKKAERLLSSFDSHVQYFEILKSPSS